MISDDSGKSDCESDGSNSVLTASSLDTPSPVPVKKVKKMKKKKNSPRRSSEEKLSKKDKKQGMNSHEVVLTPNEKNNAGANEAQPKPKKKKSVKKLAKKAAKKGDERSEKSIMELAKQAMRIESEAVGAEMETELVRIEELISKWMADDVEEENIQRFAARILNKLKEVDVLCAVDHAIFKREIGVVRLLEMDLNENASDTLLDMAVNKDRADKLLSLVVGQEEMNRLDQTKQGTAWVINSPIKTPKKNNNPGKSTDYLNNFETHFKVVHRVNQHQNRSVSKRIKRTLQMKRKLLKRKE